MVSVIIDNVQFEIRADGVLWLPPSADTFTPAPSAYARIALALALSDYESRADGVYILDSRVFVRGEDGISLPMARGIIEPMRAACVITGTLAGEATIEIVTFDDPLDSVITAREAESLYGFAKDTARKAAQRGQLPARKSAGTWLLLEAAARQMWG
ncbi:MAG: hypothetical protein SGJ24_18275 [Chloroflexota bacterium]|nr:hypothetical protein [Chloroflexota bacterium]